MGRQPLVTLMATFSVAAGCGSGSGSVGGDAGTAVSDGLSSVPEAGGILSLDDLMDPVACKGCHPQQYQTWSGSMHAYAGESPVFVALNKRGQREAHLGDFCLRCHAPMAQQMGLSTDGSNLAEVPAKYKGVTCYFCHSVADVQGIHDNPIVLRSDGVMIGQLSDPAPTSAHASAYASWLDRDEWDSSTMCGSCHDIKTGAGTIERTYQEWAESVFAQKPGGATCSQCHMDQSTDLEPGAAGLGLPLRRLHDHGYPAIDLALIAFPETHTQRAQVQAFLDGALQSALCVRSEGGNATIQVVLDNVASGHGFPSGAAMIRRAWVELKAFVGDQIIYQSGVVPDGGSVVALGDPDLWLMRDCLLDDNNREAMPWAATHFESSALPAQLTFDRNDPNFYRSHVYEVFPRVRAAQVVDGGVASDGGVPESSGGPSLSAVPDRVQMRVRLESVGADFIENLIASGDLDPSFRNQIPVFNLGGDAPLEWTPTSANELFLDQSGAPVSCISKTNLKAQAGRVRASEISHCKPQL